MSPSGSRPYFWRFYVLLALLPLLWGWAVPYFIRLDPIAFDAARDTGLVCGVLASIGMVLLTIRRLRHPITGAFPYQHARDFVAVVCLSSLGRWFLALEGTDLTQFASFAVLSGQMGIGLGFGVWMYFMARQTARNFSSTPASARRPGLRRLMTVSSAAVALIVVFLLAVGLTARSAGRLNELRAAKLADIADQAVTDLDATRSVSESRRLLRAWNEESGIQMRLTESQSTVPWSQKNDHIVTTNDGFFMVDQWAQRWHILRRQTDGKQLWIRARSRERPPIQAADTTLAIVLLAGLLLGSPIIAFLAGLELKRELHVIADGLRRLSMHQPSIGNTSSPGGDESIALPGVPIPGNDEAGDLASQLNETCRTFAQTNQRLIDELRLAAQGDAAQGVVLRSASHELRFPLIRIQDLCSELEKSGLPSSQKDDVQVIGQAAEQLAGHVEDILHMTELDDWKELPLEITSFDIKEVARDVLIRLADRAAPGLAVEIAGADDLPLVRGDRQRIDQVLSNLIENAFKYTTEGFVRVTATHGQTGTGQAAIHLQVWDSGCGIADAHRELIFSEFYRIPATRVIPGTGLGLAITRRLVERHGGHIWVESIEGEGSTFHLMLPAVSAQA